MSATVYLETFGCQMNVADSERAAVRLRAAGFNLGDSPESADVIIFNTCSVRRLLHQDRKSTRLNSSHSQISYAVFCLKKKKTKHKYCTHTTPSTHHHCQRTTATFVRRLQNVVSSAVSFY